MARTTTKSGSPGKQATTTDTVIGDDTKDEVVKLYLAGEKLDAITKQTGVSRPTVYWTLNQRGITPTRAKRAPSDSVSVDQLLHRLEAQARDIGRLEGELERANARLAELTGRRNKAAAK